MRPHVLFVGRTRYRLPLDPSLARKWDALGDAMDVHVLARAAERNGGGDARFRLARPVRPRALDGAAFYATLMGWKVRSDDGQQAVLDIGEDAGGIIIGGGLKAPPPEFSWRTRRDTRLTSTFGLPTFASAFLQSSLFIPLKFTIQS